MFNSAIFMFNQMLIWLNLNILDFLNVSSSLTPHSRLVFPKFDDKSKKMVKRLLEILRN